MNKFIFLGRLTKDVESRTAGSTIAANTSIAVNRRFTNQDGERQSDFFNLTAFGKTAEFMTKYFAKGQQVVVEGRIQNRSWDDSDGKKRYATDFIVENIYFADSKKTSNSSVEDDSELLTLPDEDLPF